MDYDGFSYHAGTTSQRDSSGAQRDPHSGMGGSGSRTYLWVLRTPTSSGDHPVPVEGAAQTIGSS
jgi:hypothetical protein